MLFVPCVNSPLIASRATLYFSDGLNLLFLLIHRLLRFGENYILFFTFFGPNLPHHYKPLLIYQTIISLISSTKTKTGLTVKARLDKKIYKKGIKVSKDEMNLLNIVGDKFHGEWNYSVKPRK